MRKRISPPVCTVAESKIQAKILNWLRGQGYWAVKTVCCNVSGVPDILCCAEGRFVAIEVKDGKRGKVSPIQEYQIERIKASKGIAFVARSLEDVIRFFE